MDEIDDYCYECQGYGNNYGEDENGEEVYLCDGCVFSPLRRCYLCYMPEGCNDGKELD